MSLETRLAALVASVGGDYKQLRTWLTGTSIGTLSGLTTADKSSIIAAINEIKNSAGGGGVDPYAPPVWAGTRAKPFDPASSMYNMTPSSMYEIRAAMSRSATARIPIEFRGHSIMAGAYSVIGQTDMASQVRRVLLGEGANVSGTGFVLPTNNTGTAPVRDYRLSTMSWTPSGVSDGPWAYAMGAGAVATLQPDLPGTICEYATYGGKGYGPISFYVDDILVETFDPSVQPAGVIVRSYTGFTNAPHKLECRSTTADPQGTVLVGMRVRNATGFEVSDVAMGGSTTTQWASTIDIGLRTTANGISPAANGIVFLGVTGNDLIQGIPIATVRANLQTIIGELIAQGRAPILMGQPPGRTYENGGQYVAFNAANLAAIQDLEYDMADEFDIPLMDMSHMFISYNRMVTEGWMADDIHMVAEAQSVVARTIAQVLLRNQPYDSRAEATDSIKGVVEMATNAESISGLSPSLAVSPASLKASMAVSPGAEMGYTEKIVNFTTTNVTADAAAGTITGFTLTVVGEGKPVEINVELPIVYHSVASAGVVARLLVNGSSTTPAGLAKYEVMNITGTTTARRNGISMRRRAVLTNGISYTFTINLRGDVAGTVTALGILETPMAMSVIRRG